MLTCFCFVPMVGSITVFIRAMMPATVYAAESSPLGKITLAARVFTWFHFIDGGLPPNSWALVKVAVENSRKRGIISLAQPGNLLIGMKVNNLPNIYGRGLRIVTPITTII